MGCGARRYWFFFFNDTATTEIYTLSLHDALPISKMVKEQKLTLVEVCMLVNGRMGENMVKEHTLNMVLSFTLMGESMWGNTRMGKSGTEHITTITGKKNTSW